MKLRYNSRSQGRPGGCGVPFGGCAVFAFMFPVIGLMSVGGTFFALNLLPIMFTVVPLAVIVAVIFIIARAAIRMSVGPAVQPSPFARQPTRGPAQVITPTPAARMNGLQMSLPPALRDRSVRFAARVEQLLPVLRGSEDVVTRSDSADGLARLGWVHLKLLIAKAHLEAAGAAADAPKLHAQVADLRSQLKFGEMSDSARESRKATLEMLEERLRNFSLRQCRLDEIASDLDRVEAQVDLAAERAALQSGQSLATFQIDLATRMVDDADFFGSVSPEVRAVDEHYGFREVRSEK